MTLKLRYYKFLRKTSSLPFILEAHLLTSLAHCYHLFVLWTVLLVHGPGSPTFECYPIFFLSLALILLGVLFSLSNVALLHPPCI